MLPGDASTSLSNRAGPTTGKMLYKGSISTVGDRQNNVSPSVTNKSGVR